MRVPLSWLAAHVDGLPTDADAVGEAFVRVGLEVEDVHRGPELSAGGLRPRPSARLEGLCPVPRSQVSGARWWRVGSSRSRS